jgi:CheY-like chemotaxis protein
MLARFNESGKGRIQHPDPLDLNADWVVKSDYALDPVAKLPGVVAFSMPVGLAQGRFQTLASVKAQDKSKFPLVTSETVATSSAKESTPVKSLKILLVDDVETNREIIRRGLKRDGHQFVEAENGEQAVALAQEAKFDVILMDLDMPVMDGLEATRHIRAKSLNQQTFMIALSGFAYQDDIKSILEAGMNQHMAKPINLKKLKAILAEQFSETS